jgi:hypothetical protein
MARSCSGVSTLFQDLEFVFFAHYAQVWATEECIRSLETVCRHHTFDLGFDV